MVTLLRRWATAGLRRLRGFTLTASRNGPGGGLLTRAHVRSTCLTGSACTSTRSGTGVMLTRTRASVGGSISRMSAYACSGSTRVIPGMASLCSGCSMRRMGTGGSSGMGFFSVTGLGSMNLLMGLLRAYIAAGMENSTAFLHPPDCAVNGHVPRVELRRARQSSGIPSEQENARRQKYDPQDQPPAFHCEKITSTPAKCR